MTLHIGSVGTAIRANTMEPEVFRQFVGVLAGGAGSGWRVGVPGSGDLAVVQHAAGANMSVDVAPGFALIPGTQSAPTQGIYHGYNDATVNVAIAASNPTYPRIDLVCVSVQDAYYSGGSNAGVLQAVTGTASASPAIPSPPANSLIIAHVYVGANVSTITNSNINGTAGAGNPDSYGFTPYRSGGVLGRGAATGGTITSITSPGSVIPGFSSVCNVQANRNIRIRFTVCVGCSAAVVVEPVILMDGAVLTGTSLDGSIAAGGWGIVTQEVVVTPTGGYDNSGIHLFTGNIFSNVANTITTYGASGQFVVEDLGPV